MKNRFNEEIKLDNAKVSTVIAYGKNHIEAAMERYQGKQYFNEEKLQQILFSHFDIKTYEIGELEDITTYVANWHYRKTGQLNRVVKIGLPADE